MEGGKIALYTVAKAGGILRSSQQLAAGPCCCRTTTSVKVEIARIHLSLYATRIRSREVYFFNRFKEATLVTLEKSRGAAGKFDEAVPSAS